MLFENNINEFMHIINMPLGQNQSPKSIRLPKLNLGCGKRIRARSMYINVIMWYRSKSIDLEKFHKNI